MEFPAVTITPKGNQAVSGRQLHEYLEIRKHFTEWFNDQKIWFLEGVDYKAVHLQVKASNGIGSTTRTDYVLTLECAKNIAMMSKTEKGKEVRRYFLECERMARQQPVIPGPKQLALMVLKAEEEKEQLQLQLQGQEPMVEYYQKVLQAPNTYTTTRTHTYDGKDETTHTSTLTVWTESGRQFLHTLFK